MEIYGLFYSVVQFKTTIYYINIIKSVKPSSVYLKNTETSNIIIFCFADKKIFRNTQNRGNKWQKMKEKSLKTQNFTGK